LIERPNRSTSELAQKLEVVTVVARSGRVVRTAVEPIKEARIAVGLSLVLRHEHVDLDLAFVWCIGHSSPSL
jgi:hypothetical protein